MTTRLEQLRYDRGWTRQDLAKEAKVSDETIRQIEENGSKPRVGTAKKLADALNVSASEILRAAHEAAA